MGTWLTALRRRAPEAAAGRLPRLIVGASAGLLLALWAGVLWLLVSSREAAIGYALKNDTHLAVAVAEQTARVFDSVNEALERLAAAAQDGTLRPTDYARFASETGLGHEILTQLSLVGADGRFIGSDLDPTGSASGVVDLSDRPHVRVHLAPVTQAGAAAMFLGLPTLGKVSQVWTVQLSKRVGPRERPAGVVVASLRVAYFEAMFSRLQAERGDVLALVGADGVVRAATQGHAAVQGGRPWPDAAHLGLADDTVWSMGSLQPPGTDGDRLLFSRQKVHRYPLHVVVAGAESTALKAWRQSATVVVAMAALINGIVVLAAVAVLRSVRRLHEKNQALAASEAHATELSESRGRWLAERTAELAATQHQLVQQEKLAALGQLVASVAHEINTPISAIAATGRNIGEALGQALDDVPRLRLQLDEPRWALFLQLLRQRQQAPAALSTREERTASRALARQLQAWGLADAADAAACGAQLVRLGVTPESLPALRPLLMADEPVPGRDALLAAALNLGTIDEGTRLINTAVQRVSKIVYSLKSLSHPGAEGALQPARLAEGLEHALTLYSHHFRQGVVLVRQIAACPPLHCSPDELNQVWLNLIHNALHAMQGQGTLTVSLHAEAADADGPHRAWQVVRIADTGGGIAPEIQARVFDAFFTTKPAGEGSGLGLDISRRIVERHGGRISFDSRPGQGTSFEVRLPADALAEAAPAASPRTPDIPEPTEPAR